MEEFGRNRAEDVERGLRLIPHLGEVMPDEANEEINGIYEGMRTHLRVPFVNFIFRVLANYPPYLSFAWRKIESHLLPLRFEEQADTLRARALVEPVPERTDWGSSVDLGQIRGFTDTIHYVFPKLLLIVSAFEEGLGGERCDRGSQPEAAVGSEVAEGTTSLQMVTSGEATGRTAEIFPEIRECHGHPDAASYYRGIAQWPEFLDAVWEIIRSLIGTPPYEEPKHALLEEARSAVLELPLPCRDEAVEHGLKKEQIEEVRAILAVFHFRVISDLFLDVSLIKAMLDGPEAARSSRFSFARGHG